MRKNIGFLVAAGAFTLPGLAAAAGPTLSDVLVNSGITATGSLQGSYVEGLNKGQTLAGYFSPKSSTFSLNQANLSLGYLPSEGFGGLVNVMAGDEATAINSVYSSSESNFSLVQGYVQYAGGPLTIMAGRYTTLSGAEVIDGSLDSNASRSFVFTLAEPYVHTGVRASYKLTDAITAYAGVANTVYGTVGTGTATDNNKPKAIESGLSFAASQKLSLSLFNYYSRETDSVSANFMDFVATYKATDKLTLVLNGDWYTYRQNAEEIDGNIAGLAGYVNYAFTPKISGSLRGEYLQTKNVVWFDGDGKSSISEITGTLSYSPVSSFTLMGEVRYDMGGQKIYPDSKDFSGFVTAPVNEGSSDSQGSVQLKAIFKFGTPSA